MIAFFCWLFLYLAVCAVTAALALPLWVTAVVTVLYTAVLVIWLCSHAAWREWFTSRADRWVAALPLFVFAATNVLFLQGITFSAAWVCAICGAVAEELLFRGFLVSALQRKSFHIAVWVSAMLFSAYHLIGGGYVQAVCALCFGFALATYVCRFRLVLPCVAAHLLTNAFGNSNVPTWVLWCCCAVCSIYGCWLYFHKKEN